MRKLMTLLLSLTALVSYAQPKPAYSIFTADGKQTDYGKMLKTLQDADVIFIGETHNCPIGWNMRSRRISYGSPRKD